MPGGSGRNQCTVRYVATGAATVGAANSSVLYTITYP
ncbi:hypothetical protein N234_02610 [Ralstonia pickettii DTP0602]|nr:hypothetical protein N234_02610 [Ralstonia pickettii DTP0602]